MATVKRLPSLNALKAFAVAAQHGSFTLAGEVLHVTQGAISRQVKQLEASMGVALFVRVHQKVELTEAGRELATTLTRLFDDMEDAVEAAVEKATGRTRRQMLSVNVPPTFATRWLAPRLSDFRAAFPHIDVSITTERIQTLREAREARGLDCLIVFGTQPWPLAVCEPLMRERHIMVSSPSLWRDGQPRALADSTLLHILDGDRRIPVWEDWIALHGPTDLDARPGMNFSTLDQAINAAVAGAGVVVVDQAMVVRELRSGVLCRHAAQFMNGPNGYWFVESAHQAVPASHVVAFKKWLLEQLAQASSEKLGSDAATLRGAN